MKDGFAKELVERERYGHGRSYSEVRHSKRFKHVDTYFGGREPMKKRYDDRKSFNENLNPLWGWLRGCVGKKWDKSYGQLRKQFDARSVINGHILEHLFQEVETHTFVDDKGRVMYHSNYAWGDRRERPISESSKDYYVCPKDGILKATKKQPRRSVIKQREAEKLKAQLAKKRVLEDGSELRKGEDGIWYLYQFAELPKATLEFVKPAGQTTFFVGWHRSLGQQTSRLEKTWDELNQSERARFGEKRYSVKGVRDADGVLITPSTTGPRRYCAVKKTAPRNLLRKLGLDGTAAANDESMLSHRDLNKYRKAA